jgi:uncharacterized protein YjiS (DUF1127 family)
MLPFYPFDSIAIHCHVRRERVVTLRRMIGAAVRWCVACADRRRQRRALARLDGRLLSDIGISRCDAEREIEKPFWR